MKSKTILGASSLCCSPQARCVADRHRKQNITGIITGGEKLAMAVPDLRGTGDAQKFMNTFNATLWDELDNAGRFEDGGQEPVSAACAAASRGFRAAQPPQRPRPKRPAPWLTDWSGPPVNANDLAFGYTGGAGGASGAARMAVQFEPADARRRAVDSAKVFRLARRRRREESGARIRRRHPDTVRRQESGRHQDLFCLGPHRPAHHGRREEGGRERNLVHGLRWLQPASADQL